MFSRTLAADTVICARYRTFPHFDFPLDVIGLRVKGSEGEVLQEHDFSGFLDVVDFSFVPLNAYNSHSMLTIATERQ